MTIRLPGCREANLVLGQKDKKYPISGKSFVRNVQEKRSRKSRKFCPFVQLFELVLHPIPTSCSRPQKTGTKKQPFLSFRHSPAHSGKRSPSQKFHQRTSESPLYQESSQTGRHYRHTVSPRASAGKGGAWPGNFPVESCTKNFQPDFALTTLNL